MKEMQQKTKEDIENFYEKQSAQKTSDLKRWLNSGCARIPQPETYYYFEDRKIHNALELARLKPGAKILEMGCSLGQMTFVLNQKGYSVTGTDISPNSIDKAMLRVKHFGLENISFEVQDAEEIKGHEGEEFDAVFSFSAFRYFPNREKALSECFRLLKPKGSAVIDFPNRYCPWFSILKPAVFIKKHIHDNLFDVSLIRNMMMKAGFVDIEFRQFLFTYKELPSFLLPLLKTTDFILEHLPVIRKMSAIIMVKGMKP
ncbi:MAG: class I SAM-dependent methyltransferase [Chitinispirillaceae bacterium]|nr:class I SAM-dependent methyltransferase [Chitinispirillaceae bacterium]